MFRPVRKKASELSIDSTKALLRNSRRGVLAVNGDNGYPYAIPINYFYDEKNKKIYFHGTAVGHKADAIKANEKVCFTVYGDEIIKEEAWAPFVQSAVVFGKCHLIEDRETIFTLLKQLSMKYYPDESIFNEEMAASGKAVRMYAIDIEHLSGKEVQEK